jgi:Domain of unknown function (DUF4224)
MRAAGIGPYLECDWPNSAFYESVGAVSVSLLNERALAFRRTGARVLAQIDKRAPSRSAINAHRRRHGPSSVPAIIVTCSGLLPRGRSSCCGKELGPERPKQMGCAVYDDTTECKRCPASGLPVGEHERRLANATASGACFPPKEVGVRAMSDSAPFLADADLRRLTGRHQKSRQIEWLRAAGVPFRVNATGHAVVLWAALTDKDVKASEGWQPRALEV